MLDLISHSKIRRKIILLLIYNRDKTYYINEIARIVGTSSGTAQRELRRLSENDFVSISRKGNLVLYGINEANPLLKEIEGIIQKTIGIEEILKKAFKEIPGIEYAFIFGSYAKNLFQSQSDIDLYIIGTAEEEDFEEEINGAEKMIQKEINYHLSDLNEFVRKSKESHFHKEILQQIIMIKGDEDEFRKHIA